MVHVGENTHVRIGLENSLGGMLLGALTGEAEELKCRVTEPRIPIPNTRKLPAT
jgi:hypothetical protein